MLEVYPHAALVALFDLSTIIKYKKGNVAQKRAGLRELQGRIADLSTHVPPLPHTVELTRLISRDVAALAALKDSRFKPVSAAELGKLEYEISVLSPLRRVTDIKQIRIGRDGLVLWKGSAEGILLPQVPTEFGWDRKTFLEQLCVKAGLPTNAWQDEETDIFMFSALVFGEDTPEPFTAPQSQLGGDELRLPRRPGQD